MDIFLLRAAVNGLNLKNASSSSKNGDLKGIIKSVALSIVGAQSSGGRSNFLTPTVDLEEIDSAYNTDSYIRQSIDKHTELMFKSGWTLESTNDKAKEYLNMRFSYMGYTTGTPFDQLLIELSEDLVKYSNAFLIKARDKKGIQIPGMKATGIGKNAQPIAGYFRANPKTMQVQVDEYGTISSWQQQVSGGKSVTFKPEDVVHIYYKREAGEVFGKPFIAPALEDVRLLRKLEDNIAMLIYRYSIPIYQFIIGAMTPGFEATQDEIDEAKGKINEMPTDGIIITNERTKIETVGAQGSAIDASPYLTYFENRVFTGLGVSATQMGRGSTANKGTADNLDQQMVDRIKSFQRVLSYSLTYNVILELLMEGGFDPLNKQDDLVKFSFNEINIDTQIKVENHKSFLFEHNCISLDELRSELGRPAADEGRLYSNLFGQVGSTDETSNLDQPANQHGKKLAPKISPTKEIKESTTQNSIKSAYYTFMNDTNGADREDVKLIIGSAVNMIYKNMSYECINSINNAISDVIKENNSSRSAIIDSRKVLNIVESQLKSDIYNILSDVSNKADINNSKAVFDTNYYRIEFALSYWTRKAYIVSKVEMYKARNIKTVEVFGKSDDDEFCKSKSGELSLTGYMIKSLPPFHPGCKCDVKPKE